MIQFQIKFTFCLLIFLLFSFFQHSWGQTPGNLNSDVTVTPNWSSVTNIENSFNMARREEETQLGLGVNSIQNLDIPDANWNTWTDDQKALYILNDERTSRAGINYGAGPVKGLPFNGIELAIDNVA